MNCLYRYVAQANVNGIDELDQTDYYSMKLRCDEYEIVKTTPKGCWIKVFMGKPKFVLLTATKKFACPTKKEALQSLIARKKKEIQIHQYKIEFCQKVLTLCEKEVIVE